MKAFARLATLVVLAFALQAPLACLSPASVPIGQAPQTVAPTQTAPQTITGPTQTQHNAVTGPNIGPVTVAPTVNVPASAAAASGDPGG